MADVCFFKNGNSYLPTVNWDISTNFSLLIDFDYPNRVASTSRKPEVVFSGRGSHLEKMIWRHICAMCAPIWTKFSSLMSNGMQITVMWSKSKPGVEFLYGKRLFFKNGSSYSYIAAMNQEMSAKFGLLIVFDLLKVVTSTITKPEVVLSGRVRHLEKSIWRHISAASSLVWMEFGSLVQNSMPIVVI